MWSSPPSAKARRCTPTRLLVASTMPAMVFRTLCIESSSVFCWVLHGAPLPPEKEGGGDEDQRDREQDGGDGVDFRRHAEAHHAVDIDRQGGRAGARDHHADQEIVERDDEGHDGTCA